MDVKEECTITEFQKKYRISVRQPAFYNEFFDILSYVLGSKGVLRADESRKGL